MCDLTNYKIFYCNPIALYSAHNFSSSISYTRHIILIGNTVFMSVFISFSNYNTLTLKSIDREV